MLSRYSHIRTEAKRDALEAVERKRTTAREQRNAAERERTGEVHTAPVVQ